MLVEGGYRWLLLCVWVAKLSQFASLNLKICLSLVSFCWWWCRLEKGWWWLGSGHFRKGHLLYSRCERGRTKAEVNVCECVVCRKVCWWLIN